MATAGTLKQALYLERIQGYGIREQIIDLPCPALVVAVEVDRLSPQEMTDYVHSLLLPYAQENVGGVVLGCTHFLHARKEVAEAARRIWPDARLFDGNDGVSRQLGRVLEANDMRNQRQAGGNVVFYTSGDSKTELLLFEKLFRK